MNSVSPIMHEFCIVCGSPRIARDQTFCGKCGTSFSEAAPTLATTSTPSAAQTVVPPSRTGISPLFWAVGGLAIVAIVAVVVFVAVTGQPGGASNSGGITFTPSTLSCSNPAPFTWATRFPASLKIGETLSLVIDGKTLSTGSVNAGYEGYVQQPDGSWIMSNSFNASWSGDCGHVMNGVVDLTTGNHIVQIVDSNGKIISQGSYTVNP